MSLEALFAAATVLGLLAFFEPCTIATHTLFSAAAHRAPKTGCCRDLLTVWGVRTALCAGLLAAVVAVTPAPSWNPWLPSVALSLMAVVYVLSRHTYIPLPHLALYRLLPGGERLPFAVRLGLTLPACTLPLFVVVAALAATLDSLLAAVGAGVLFATWFTLPVAVTAWRGMDAGTRRLLTHAARWTPYLTAVLLLGMALYLLLPQQSWSPKALVEALSHPGPLGLGLAFLAGLLFSFNPVSFAAIPVVLAYVTRAGEPRRALFMGGAFVAGMILTHAVLGVAAALGGDWVRAVMGRAWGVFLGPLLIALGLIWGGWWRPRLPWFRVRAGRVSGAGGAFLLGIPFSVAVCPSCTPALLATLTASAAIGSPAYGLLLLLAFAVGRSLPILLGAWSMGALERLRVLARHQRILEQGAGVVFILAGLYLLNEYFFFIEY